MFEAFSFCETTKKMIDAMPTDTQLRFYKAVSDFGIYGIEPDFEGMEAVVWLPMYDFIQSSKANDEAWKEKQRTRGRHGGAPAGNRNAAKGKVEFTSTVQTHNSGTETDISNAQTHNQGALSGHHRAGFYPTAPPLSPPIAEHWEKVRKHGNTKRGVFSCEYLWLNLAPAKADRVRGVLNTYGADKVVKAIDAHFKDQKAIEKGWVCKDIYNFLERMAERYVEV
jgi:hypothetical protein